MFSYGINYAILFANQGERIYQGSYGVECGKTTQEIHTKLQKNFKIQDLTKERIHGR